MRKAWLLMPVNVLLPAFTRVMVRRGCSSFKRRYACTYTRGSVRRTSGFVLTGKPELIGMHRQFLFSDDSLEIRLVTLAGETTPNGLAVRLERSPRARIAIVSDIHGHLTAFEAVLADLRQTSPDLVLHGGDLVHRGSMSAEIVDRIRELGWEGVVGNTDEMLWTTESLDEFARTVPKLAPLMATIRQMIPPTLEKLGDDRLAWLRNQPRMQRTESVALVHASPESCWRAPMPNATDEEIESTYAGLGRAMAVYGHIHRSHVRRLRGMTVVNMGSVSLSYDGDPRASYLLLDGSNAMIRRVSYDVEAEPRREKISFNADAHRRRACR